MKKTYGFAIIGCGAIANIHAEAIKSIENAVLVGVCDYSFAAAQSFAKKNNCKAYNSQEEMLKDSNVSIVNICTPSGLHYKQVIDCAKAKKHIIIEKPMAITKAQMDEAICEVNNSNVKVEVISQLRFTYAVQMLKKAIDEGKLGKIFLADFRMKYYRSPEYYAQSPWRGTWSMDGGGALMNQGIHGIDLMQYVMGGVKSVYADCRTLARKIEVEDVANLLVEYNSGAIGVIECATLAKPGYERKMEIHGENGTIIVSEDTIEVWDVDGMERPDFGESKINSSDSPMNFSEEYHAKQFQDLINAIEEDKKPLIDMYEGKKAVDIILAAYESSKNKTRVELQ